MHTFSHLAHGLSCSTLTPALAFDLPRAGEGGRLWLCCVQPSDQFASILGRRDRQVRAHPKSRRFCYYWCNMHPAANQLRRGRPDRGELCRPGQGNSLYGRQCKALMHMYCTRILHCSEYTTCQLQTVFCPVGQLRPIEARQATLNNYSSCLVASRACVPALSALLSSTGARGTCMKETRSSQRYEPAPNSGPRVTSTTGGRPWNRGSNLNNLVLGVESEPGHAL